MNKLVINEKIDNFIGFSVTNSMLQYIDRLSDLNKTTRSEVIRAIIRSFQEQDAESK